MIEALLNDTVTNMMPGRLALAISHCRRVLLDAMQYTETFVSVTFIDTDSGLFLVCKNSDKFYHRKIMWAADEKLTIDKLGLKDSLLNILVPRVSTIKQHMETH